VEKLGRGKALLIGLKGPNFLNLGGTIIGYSQFGGPLRGP